MAAPPAVAASELPASIFAKTTLCRFHHVGLCRRGRACQWAHGLSELRQAPNLHNTKMCPAFRRSGICSNPVCGFAHSKDEKRRLCTPGGQSVSRKVEFGCASAMYFWWSADGFSHQLTTRTEGTESEHDSSLSASAGGTTIGSTSKSNDTGSCNKSDMTLSSASSTSTKDPRMRSKEAKMCKFGKACKRGARCRFAHSREELQMLLESSQTSLSPEVIDSGCCTKADCTSAPNSAKDAFQLKASLQEPAQGSHGDAETCHLVLKNTFLAAEVWPASRRRCLSEPPLGRA